MQEIEPEEKFGKVAIFLFLPKHRNFKKVRDEKKFGLKLLLSSVSMTWPQTLDLPSAEPFADLKSLPIKAQFVT